MKKKLIIGGISAIALIFVIFIGLIIDYNNGLSPVKEGKEEVYEIKSGTPALSVLNELTRMHYFKKINSVKIYCKLTDKCNFKAGRYKISQEMSAQELIEMFNTGNVIDDSITLRLVEGKRLVDYVKTISDTFDYSYDDIMNVLKDKEFLNELINNYWFIDESILNDKIYYPLEGYLYPDTYKIDVNASIKDIIIKLINTLDAKLKPFKEDIEKSKYSFHELLTLSSLIEAEAATEEDRKLVSGVFYNRLKDGWTLGSDVTAYYGVNKTFTDVIYQADLDNCNPYNTRSNCVKGLPIGPINSPSLSSINASIYPTDNDYYYFVADKTKKVYFSKTSAEQSQVIQELKKNGLWL